MPGSARTGQKRQKTRVGTANADRILDCALSAFARHGLRGTTVEQIAETAGMSKTNLLYYFPNKNALYASVLTRMLDIWLAPLAELKADRPPAAALCGYIAAKLDCSRRFPEASRLFAIEIMQGAPHLQTVLSRDLAAMFNDKTALLESWIRQGRLRPVDPRHLLFTIWATTQHYADFSAQITMLTGQDLSDEAFFEGARQALTDTILHGVLPLEER